MSSFAIGPWRRHVVAVLAALILTQAAGAADAAPAPAKPEGTVLVPEDFLRRWDPVTLFFDDARGPAGGGPEAHPGEHVTLSPDHPGSYTWLNDHTLQFRPAEPWPALSAFTWRFDGEDHRLATLMAPAIRTRPADGSDDLAPVDSISLRFRDPVDKAALERMVSIEVRALPGIEPEPVRTLDAEDFTVKRMERGSRDAPVDYVLRLREPIPAGRKALVRLRLSLEDTAGQAMQTIAFTTRRAFQPVSFGCASQQRTATAEGVRYAAAEALVCDPGNRTIELAFTARPRSVGPVPGRNLVRFEPAVDNLEYRLAGKRLRITGDFRAETRYRLSIVPSDLRDVHGRALQATGVNSLYFAFPPREDFLNVNRNRGRAVMERFGPQMLPLRGRGDTRLDLRIHAIDPLAPRFWPYEDRPVGVDDDAMPPGPGEEPVRSRRLRRQDVAAQIKALGSPSVSRIVDLPLERGGPAARFGLDLKPHLQRLAGDGGPGAYLVGVRRLGPESQRQWVRVQVTDLSLTAVEEEDQVRFVVTSLRTGRPVPDARVRVQTTDHDDDRRLTTVLDGRTDSAGQLAWSPRPRRMDGPPERLIVSRGDDTLVIDARANPPKRYHDNHFTDSGRWLRWTDHGGRSRRPQPEWRCHLFTERPVYRPTEPVHIKGFLRRVHRGELQRRDAGITLLVTAPDGSEWRYQPELSEAGGFYHFFDEKTEATGEYRITAEVDPAGKRQHRCADISVRKEAYRIPRFEVRTDAPERTGLDGPFQVDLVAEYYAGGVARERPVHWKVTQFPYRWTPVKREGFVYSTDARFSGIGEFKARPTLTRQGTTDERGFARIQVDPSLEPSAQPRRYVIEATVIGADDQTVTDTADVLALPPFALGLKAPRYLENADRLEGAFLVAGPDGEMMPGKDVTLRLVKRNWAARLQASDFTTGEPRYETEIIDETLLERTVTSADSPVPFDLPLDDTGVYILELSARDALGRLQTVKLDLFNDGSRRATWPQAPAETFQVSTVDDSHAPGDTATLLLESPFAEARALAIVELPGGGNRYEWVRIADGKGTFELPIEREYMPGVPVHFILMRGRLEDAPRQARSGMDLGKPVMMAATTRVDVSTAGHRIDVALDHPEKAQPGDTVDLTVTLTDRHGDPVSGEVTLWLVDQAVLALGEEQPLDPLPAFIRERPIRTEIRDTRNRVIGYLPFVKAPGGGEAAREAGARKLLDQVSIRKDFRSVPYFEPTLSVGDDGRATVRIDLPDNLTNFMIRAKAIGPGDRLGHAKSQLRVRLPVIVQPSLPRFVRYGDQLTLSAVARVVEGNAGEGRAVLDVSGLTLEGRPEQRFAWPETRTRRLDYPVSVPMPEEWPEDPGAAPEARVKLAVERRADGVGDGFRTDLPVLPDRRTLTDRFTGELTGTGPITVPALDDGVRPGSLRRTLVLAERPGLIRMTAGLNYLLAYPHACTEQRISRARGLLAAGKLLELVRPGTATELIDRHVRATLSFLDEVIREDGTVTFWPGSGSGQVGLTAWTYLFLVEAEQAGYTVDSAQRERVRGALRHALRGDYSSYLNRYAERSMALTALARGGDLDAGYAAELARRTQFLPQEAVARVTRALASDRDPSPQMLQQLQQALWNGLIFKLRRGEEVYAGLKERQNQLSPLILPSESRTLAQTLRAAAAVPDGTGRERILAEALVTLGRGNGWGTTNANAEAILALNDFLMAPDPETEPVSVEARWGSNRQRVRVGGDHPVQATPTPTPGEVAVTAPALGADRRLAVMAESRYVPRPRGDQVAAESQGFVVKRTLVRVGDGETADRRVPLDAPGATVDFAVGEVAEDRLTLVNPAERHHVAVVMPLAAGMEPLNPALETAPPEARPSRPLTREPAYVAARDDRVAYYYETLPKGTYEFAFRLRAQVPGEFVQPAAYAELMYQEEVRGHGNGALIRIDRSQEP